MINHLQTLHTHYITLPRSRKVWGEALKPLEYRKEILDSPPFNILPDEHQKQKIKAQIFRKILNLLCEILKQFCGILKLSHKMLKMFRKKPKVSQNTENVSTSVLILFSYRSTRSKMFFKIGVLKNIVLFTGIYLCLSLFSVKLQACRL